MSECRTVYVYEYHAVTDLKKLGRLLSSLSASRFEVVLDAPHETDEEKDGDEWAAKDKRRWVVSARREDCRCLCSRCGEPVNPPETT